jgi:5-methyltetrahydropteroyltriglutamate--homocysteine methyltransferase
MKGMLTGPVTMLRWSFVRDDQPEAEVAVQLGLAMRDELVDLQSAGIGVIQVDEPALREGLPLRAAGRPGYLAWATRAFRLVTSSAEPATQVHTHMCYARLGDIVEVLGDLDVDVVSLEAARSDMTLVDDLKDAGYGGGVGPGVYDVHAPRVPEVAELESLLRLALGVLGPQRLWVNPDCGLKTRSYEQIVPALSNMVAAARQLREELGTEATPRRGGDVGRELPGGKEGGSGDTTPRRRRR